MRRVIGSALVAVFALAVATAGAQDKKEDKKAPLEGTYVIVGLEINGKALPEDLIAKAPEAERTIRITADQLIATKSGKEDPATYKIDATKKPAEIDVTSKKGDKEEKSYGIYKVEGDKLILCVAETENAKDRPKDFKTEGGKAVLLTLKKK